MIVDNMVPITTEGHRAFGSTTDPSEMWLFYLEKAYAKFCGSYSHLHTGDTAEALVHLTGVPTLRRWPVSILSKMFPDVSPEGPAPSRYTDFAGGRLLVDYWDHATIPSAAEVWWVLNQSQKAGLIQLATRNANAPKGHSRMQTTTEALGMDWDRQWSVVVLGTLDLDEAKVLPCVQTGEGT